MNQEERRNLQLRTTDFVTRDDGGDPVIEGYFAVFNSTYQISSLLSESIAPGAFTSSIGKDVRALINHNTDLVIGRVGAQTFAIREDERGLWGSIRINPKDTDAMNAYERVKRGDVSGCSIGFNIVREDADVSDDGRVHWTILEAELFECSICTFPAYEATNIQARQKDYEGIVERRLEAKREKVKARLRHGTETA